MDVEAMSDKEYAEYSREEIVRTVKQWFSNPETKVCFLSQEEQEYVHSYAKENAGGTIRAIARDCIAIIREVMSEAKMNKITELCNELDGVEATEEELLGKISEINLDRDERQILLDHLLKK